MYINSMPVGLLAMADCINKNGIKTQVVNLGVESMVDRRFDIIRYIQETKVKVVAISMQWHYQSYDVIEVARKIKNQIPDVYVVLGGINASFFAEEVMQRYNFIDGLIRGDGELPILSFLKQALEKNPDFKRVPNLIWRNKEGLQINPISYVAGDKEYNRLDYMNFSLLKNYSTFIDIFAKSASFYMKNVSPRANTFRRKKASIPLGIGRGCRVNCKWCGGASYTHKLISGRQHSLFRSIDRIIDDIKEAQSYGFGIFHTAHYMRPDDDRYFIDLFKRIREERLNVGWVFECSTLPTRELVDEFAITFEDRDLSFMCLSRLTPDEITRRRNIGYHYSNKELFDILDYMEEKGVSLSLTFTIGLAWENEAVINDLQDFYGKITDKYKCMKESAVLTIELEPGSFWYMFPEKYGLTTDRKNFADYYEFHSQKDTSHYNSMGYQVTGYFDESSAVTPVNFEEKIQEIRCKSFCVLNGYGSWYSRILTGPTKCNLMNTFWKIKEQTSPNKDSDYY